MQIRYSCYYNSTGYSVSAQDYILSLLKSQPDINVKLTAINGFREREGISTDRHKVFQKLHETTLRSEYISVQHCIPRIYLSDTAKKRIGVSVFETIDPPNSWVSKMNEMDKIITASHFNKGSFQSNGVNKPVEVVPHCFDSGLFNKEVTPRGRYNLFTFLYIATWRERKNYIPLIKAFYDAFTTKDQVCLVLKTDKSIALEDSINKIKNEEWKTKPTAPIFVEKKTLDFEEIPKFIKMADVCINPSMGEGLGLLGLHSMALGIPFITVRYGGCLEYSKPDYCTYINPSGYKKILNMDGLPQFQNKIWPNIQISEIKDKMIFEFKSFDHLKEKEKLAYYYVHQHFNYDIIGRRLLSTIGG